MVTPRKAMTELPHAHVFFLSLSLTGTSLHGAEFGHVPDNITVLEGESVTLR